VLSFLPSTVVVVWCGGGLAGHSLATPLLPPLAPAGARPLQAAPPYSLRGSAHLPPSRSAEIRLAGQLTDGGRGRRRAFARCVGGGDAGVGAPRQRLVVAGPGRLAARGPGLLPRAAALARDPHPAPRPPRRARLRVRPPPSLPLFLFSLLRRTDSLTLPRLRAAATG
jgi:hypothetical protein